VRNDYDAVTQEKTYQKSKQYQEKFSGAQDESAEFEPVSQLRQTQRIAQSLSLLWFL